MTGFNLARPLLGVPRAELRRYLKARHIVWRDDPMNGDPRFARVRLRAAWAAFEEAGLSAARIAAAAGHLLRAREALEDATATLLACSARPEGEKILVDGTALSAAPREIGLRALAQLLKRVSGQSYRPRFEALESLFETIGRPKFAARTLHHCRVSRAPKRLAVYGPGTIILEREGPRKAP